jgi:hypothetical protein
VFYSRQSAATTNYADIAFTSCYHVLKKYWTRMRICEFGQISASIVVNAPYQHASRWLAHRELSLVRVFYSLVLNPGADAALRRYVMPDEAA